MQSGTLISGVAHAGLILWAAVGGLFRPDAPPAEVQDITVISAQQFEAILAAQRPPEVAPGPADLGPGAQSDTAPDLSALPDAAPVLSPRPPATPLATPDTGLTMPDPPAEVAEVPLPDAEPPEGAPDSDASPVLPPAPPPRADRVAPTPIAPPPADAAPDDIARQERSPAPEAEPDLAETAPTAPEEAGRELATEAAPSDPALTALAPGRSLRPPLTPPRPDPLPVAQPEPEPEPTPVAQDAVDAAVAAALADAGAGAGATGPTGPPLTVSEEEALRVSVSRCWNVGSLSSEALATTVVVTVALDRSATPDPASIDMLSFSGGSAAAARQAFEAARRAIIRCGARGLDLPPEKYETWRNIEMTFNPERMRIR